MILTSFYKIQKKNKAQRKSRKQKSISEFTIKKINKAKSWLLMKINKIGKTLAILIKKKEKT